MCGSRWGIIFTYLRLFLGNQGGIASALTVKLTGLLWDLATTLEYLGVPVLSFVEDAKWADMARALEDESS